MHPKVAAAAQVLAESPPLGDFPRAGVIPTRQTVSSWKQAGWPSAEGDALIPHREGHAPQVQRVTYYPESWARRYAEMVGRTLADVCRGRYDPDA